LPQYELNLRDYIRIIRKRRWIIITIFLGFTIVSASSGTKAVIIYKASTTVKIEQRRSFAGLFSDEFTVNPGDIMESEVNLIVGYPVMKKVALKLQKINDKSSSEEVDQAVSELQSAIETKRVGSTNIIRITAKANAAKEAMDLANTAAQTYMEENLLGKAKQFRNARKFIEEQLVSLENNTGKIEDRLGQFGIGSVRKIKFTDSLEEKIVRLEQELFELLQRYTEKYPRII
jgi:uncharacterized protein involved in exopolysaccharide biosynthesis